MLFRRSARPLRRFRRKAVPARFRLLKTVRPYRVKKIANHLHRYVRWCQSDTSYPDVATGPSLISGTPLDQNFSYSFNLRNLVNVVDFTALYDMYRINKVTIHLERVFNVSNVLNGPINKFIRVVHDYNDNNLLTGEDQYLEYSNCKTYSALGSRPIKIVLYPKIANKIEDIVGGTAFTAVPSNKVWINTVDDTVPHFGIKMFVPTGIAGNGAPIFRVRVKYDVSFKNAK